MAAYLLYVTPWQFQNEENVFLGEGGNMRKIMV